MNQHDQTIQHLIEYYRDQGAPGDQQMLLSLLREVQEECGGKLLQSALNTIADAYRVKDTFLKALINRIPTLHLEDTPHRLEICGNCARSRELARFIEETYQVKSGSGSKQGGFFYQVTGCMKNCRRGPSLRWDGTLYPCAGIELIESLVANR